ncbi:hypothetical protein WH47_07590 [Habropoda laboriosa]|uniref:Uncharacterized protein n=1 Tax=Habropoda laboriosa TaxID=597456 RepID=A0A0L7RE86_9HYME|nr:hypothetical protein WH47_07590 [Habropoda laboriosa]
MRKVIWATFHHRISTNENPQHDYCSEGPKLMVAINTYDHKLPLHECVQNAIRPIHEDLSKNDLLERCLRGYT